MGNTVIAGDYKGKTLYFTPHDELYIGNGISGGVRISKDTVSRYELATHESSSSFSAGKAALGTAVFGAGGAVAGVNGKKYDAYRVVIYFRDGKKSLVEMGPRHYRALESELFGVESYTPSAEPEPKTTRGGSILLSVAVFVTALIVCIIIAGSIFPEVDGQIQLNFAGVLLVIGVPVLAAVFVPRFFKKKK